jgi:hypothetical protein
MTGSAAGLVAALDNATGAPRVNAAMTAAQAAGRLLRNMMRLLSTGSGHATRESVDRALSTPVWAGMVSPSALTAAWPAEQSSLPPRLSARGLGDPYRKTSSRVFGLPA